MSGLEQAKHQSRLFVKQAMGRSSEAFKARHHCESSVLLRDTFIYLDTETGGDFKCPNLASQMHGIAGVGIVSVQQHQASVSCMAPAEGMVSEWVSNLVKACEGRGASFVEYLQTLCDEVDLPDMQFAMNFCDEQLPGLINGTPIFQNQGSLGKQLLAVPRSLLELRPSSVPDKRSCAQQIPKAVFRGSTTGEGPPSESQDEGNFLMASQLNWRYFAAKLSKHRPTLLDAGFDQIVQSWVAFENLLQDLKKPRLSDEQQACYSAVLVIDGNSLPDRLPRQLLYGIPLVFMHHKHVFQPSPFPNTLLNQDRTAGIDEFWYHDLHPGEHYLEATTSDLESVLDKITNATGSDLQNYTSIGDQGRNFVLSQMSVDRLKCYTFDLLSQYVYRCR